MRLLLDTHILLWAAAGIERVPAAARIEMGDPRNALIFSTASVWEIAIKSGLNRNDLQIDVSAFRRGLLDNGYTELPITGAHAVATGALPPIHRDPFDRILIAQASVEDLTLLTSDATIAQYPGSIRLV